jgi:acyl transferase domain-containing protein/NADPH:quinone reductase-like Zn-dependent oxidoreductase/acyl carrier protein
MDINKINEDDSIAIVGMGCRFPGGADNPERLWKLMLDKMDCIVDIPADRWDYRRFYSSESKSTGTMYVNQGGFLRENIKKFDIQFFNISPREAESMDPQICLLLEVSWEAFEDAGINSADLTGSNTGVYLGGFSLDHYSVNLNSLNRRLINMHSATGGCQTMIPARISYAYDFKGPCITLDTACSSSLVSLHYACQGLLNNECDMALTGGVNLMRSPEFMASISQAQFLSPDGRCRAFDRDGNGYVRGEGAGLVVLKKLSRAITDGDRIYGLVKGTGVNQDGQTPSIAVPSSGSQKTLIQKVLKAGNIAPADVVYVEAHGTGTAIGDPIEFESISSVLNGTRQPNKVCHIGSIKTNLGHLEGAAGIAGLMKAALTLKHKIIPPNIHFNSPNPKLNYEQSFLKVPVDAVPIPDSDKPAIACVNSFGYGGTNAHAVIEEYQPQEKPSRPVASQHLYRLFPFSGKTKKAVVDLMKKYSEWLEYNPLSAPKDFENFYFSLTQRRTHHSFRAGVIADTAKSLKKRLNHIVNETNFAGAVMDKTISNTPKLAFVYTGMGPQWWGMGRELLKTEPVFRKTVETCDTFIQGIGGWSLMEELQKDELTSIITVTSFAQPANFAIQAGLTELFKSWGIQPDAVVGHSIGEVGAAYAAGVLSLEMGVQVSFYRSLLQSELIGQGGMLATSLSESNAEPLVIKFPDVSIAAINSPTSITLSGNVNSLRKISQTLETKNIFNQFLRVKIAYHSPQMDCLKDRFLGHLNTLTTQKPHLSIYSTVTGTKADDMDFGKAYWWENIRKPVNFASAFAQLVDDNHLIFMEIGPHPVLKNYIREGLNQKKKPGVSLSTLNRKRADEQLGMQEAFAGLYTAGCPIDFSRFCSPGARYVRLPNYPWQRESIRLESAEYKQYKQDLGRHVLLTLKKRTPYPSWEVELNSNFFPYLDDHQIEKTMVVPGSLYVEAGIAIHQAIYNNEACTLENIQLCEALTRLTSDCYMIMVQFNRELREYRVYSYDENSDKPPVLHAKGTIYESPAFEELKSYDIQELIRDIGEQCLDKTKIYETIESVGYDYGPHFQGLEKVWFNRNSLLAKINPSLSHETDARYFLHPVILDNALQSLIVLAVKQKLLPGLSVPTGFSQVHFRKKQCTGPFWAHCTVTASDKNRLVADIYLFDNEGSPLADLTGCEVKSLTGADDRKLDDLPYCFYDYKWILSDPGEADLIPKQTNPKWVIVGRNRSLLNKLSGVLSNASSDTTLMDSDQLIDSMDSDGNRPLEKLLPAKQDSVVNFVYMADTNPDILNIINQETEDCLALLGLVKELEILPDGLTVRLFVITQGLFSIGTTGKTHLLNSGLWGVARTVMNEFTNITCRLIDLDKEDPDYETLGMEMQVEHEAHEVAIKNKNRYHHRLEEISLTPDKKESSPVTLNTHDHDVMMAVNTPGDLDSLCYKRIQGLPPAHGEVQIQVDTASLNFKDLLKIMNLLPEAAKEGTFFKDRIGMEYSGRITQVGSGVRDFQIGDKTCFISPANSFQSLINVPVRHTIKCLPGCTMEETPVYTNFTTVVRALEHLANLDKDEYILIHGASGGIGLAAIQYAQHKGAKIIATAGSDHKREFIKNLGVEFVSDSRSLLFRDHIMEWTKGHGIDVVLNFLSDDYFTRTLSVLAPFGRFVEIGKKDIASDRYLPLELFNKNIMFASFDLDQTIAQNRKLMHRLCDEVYHYFEKGVFKPIPTTVFPAADISAAFKLMSRSKHIGKISVRFRDEDVTVCDTPVNVPIINGNTSYLITGGLSGFGLEIAEWLVKNGAKNLILTGRNEIVDKLIRDRITALEQKTRSVWVRAVDVVDFCAMEGLFSDIRTELPPLKGIFHCAMVLDDVLIKDISTAQFKKVFYPKAQGGWNLHRLSQNLPLDFFILMSSVSSLIGNPGQVNYVAGNAFLDGLARYRRNLGLVATAVNLGALKETGVISRASKYAVLESMGIYGLPTPAALKALETIIRQSPVQSGILKINWQKLAESNPVLAKSKRFSSLISNNASKEKPAFWGKLEKIAKDQHEEVIVENLKKILNKVTGIKEETLDIHQSVFDLGIDSLMSVEMQSKIYQEYSVKFSIMELIKGPSLSELAQSILSKYKQE